MALWAEGIEISEQAVLTARLCEHQQLSSPALCAIAHWGGRSSTLRLIDSITAVSGILGHPPARVTTIEYDFAISRRVAPEACWRFTL